MRKRRASERLYGLLLRLLPREFRGDFGDDMVQTFRDQRTDAASGGRRGLSILWIRTIAGLVSLAPREHLQILWRDGLYALRLMGRYRVTTAAAVFTIAIGVGANTAMFSVLRAIVLDLPYPEPEGLVLVGNQTPRGFTAAVTPAQYDAWRTSGALETITPFWSISPVLTEAGDARRVTCECSAASLFVMLGGTPLIGRTFAGDESASGEAVVISERFWRTGLGGDPQVLGRRLLLDGQPATIVGVMPRTFDGPRGRGNVDGWLPMANCVTRERAQGRAIRTINVYGRLRRGESAAAATARLEAVNADGRDSLPRLVPLVEQLVGEIRPLLLALFGASGFVLLIACVNVANLLLGRMQARRRELALRSALGCSRAGLVRQLLTESLVFAVVGGAAGLLVAGWTLSGLVPLMPRWIPGIHRIQLDLEALATGLVVALGAGLLIGVLPAWSATTVRPGLLLGTVQVGGSPARRRVRALLILAEVTLSVALLAGAGLLIKTFLHLRPSDAGFNPANKISMTVNLPRSRYPDATSWRAAIETLLLRLRSDASVERVAATSIVPMSGFGSLTEITPLDSRVAVTVDEARITPGYVEMMGIPVVSGRSLTSADVNGALEVALVNETLARRLWPDASPLGRMFAMDAAAGTPTKLIVGVVADVRSSGNRLGSRPQIYLPFAQDPPAVMRVVAQTPLPVDRFSPVVRAHLAAVDANLPAGNIESLDEVLARAVRTWTFAASLLGVLAGLAVILAAVGLFAVVSSWVAERTPEIGLRMALGATRRQVLASLLRQAAGLTIAGLLAGLLLAGLTTQLLSSWLVGVAPLDPQAFVAAAMGMAVVALGATALAARKAASIDPTIALRSE